MEHTTFNKASVTKSEQNPRLWRTSRTRAPCSRTISARVTLHLTLLPILSLWNARERNRGYALQNFKTVKLKTEVWPRLNYSAEMQITAQWWSSRCYTLITDIIFPLVNILTFVACAWFSSQINDVPVTHISDIEPLVYDSTSTIKFLVARPAQEVCTMLKYRCLKFSITAAINIQHHRKILLNGFHLNENTQWLGCWNCLMLFH